MTSSITIYLLLQFLFSFYFTVSSLKDTSFVAHIGILINLSVPDPNQYKNSTYICIYL